MNTLTPIELGAENQKVIDNFFESHGPDTKSLYSGKLLGFAHLLASRKNEDGGAFYSVEFLDDSIFELQELLKLINNIAPVKK